MMCVRVLCTLVSEAWYEPVTSQDSSPRFTLCIWYCPWCFVIILSPCGGFGKIQMNLGFGVAAPLPWQAAAQVLLYQRHKAGFVGYLDLTLETEHDRTVYQNHPARILRESFRMWWTERPLKSLTPTKTAICNSMRFAGISFVTWNPIHTFGVWLFMLSQPIVSRVGRLVFGGERFFAFFGDSWFSLSQSNLQNHHMSVSRVNWMKHAKLLNKVGSSPCLSFDLFPP